MLWHLGDQLGSTRDLVDNLGALITHYKLDSFGNIKSGDATKTRYIYTNQEYDPDTGLCYFNWRWYDPNIGRFLSEDPNPAGTFADGPNNVAYVHNGPTNATDPDGLDTHWLRESYSDPVTARTVIGGYFKVSVGDGTTNPSFLQVTPAETFLVERTTTYFVTYRQFTTTGQKSGGKCNRERVKVVMREYKDVTYKHAMIGGIELSASIANVIKIVGVGIYGLVDADGKESGRILARSSFSQLPLPPVVLRNLKDPPVVP